MVVVIDSNADIAQEKIIMKKLKKYHMAVLFLTVVAVIFLVWSIVATTLNFTSKHVEHLHVVPKAKSGRFGKAAVVADSSFCAEIARDVIIQGGNAVDAAIAASFCNGVVVPYATGIGGGDFLVFYLKEEKKCVFLNSRETAPADATEQMFFNNKESAQFGYKSIGIPGEIHGLWTAYKLYGSKVVTWSELVQPSVRLARGFPNHRAMFDYFDRIEKFASRQEGKALKRLYTNKFTGKYYDVGEIVMNSRLAKTLEAIANAEDPVKLFYEGALAEQIVIEMEQNGGIITADDLKNYTTDIRETLYTEIAGYKVCGPPPPSSWAITQLIPRIMEQQYFDKTIFNDAEFYHKLIESEKLAYGLRGMLGDELFSEASGEIARNMTEKYFVKNLNNRLPSVAQNLEYYMQAEPAIPDAGTSHTSVIDENGNAAAVTSTLNMAFGSKMLSKLGFVYNNQMDDFSTPGLVNHWGFEPSSANFIKPGRRPMSSMSPTIVFDPKSGDVRMVTGATGGSKIISATAQTLVRALLMKQNAADIVEFPRVHNQLTPLETLVEDGFSKKISDKLERSYEQEIRETKESLAVVYPITRDLEVDGKLTAAADYRRKSSNSPAGY